MPHRVRERVRPLYSPAGYANTKYRFFSNLLTTYQQVPVSLSEAWGGAGLAAIGRLDPSSPNSVLARLAPTRALPKDISDPPDDDRAPREHARGERLAEERHRRKRRDDRLQEEEGCERADWV